MGFCNIQSVLAILKINTGSKMKMMKCCKLECSALPSRYQGYNLHNSFRLKGIDEWCKLSIAAEHVEKQNWILPVSCGQNDSRCLWVDPPKWQSWTWLASSSNIAATQATGGAGSEYPGISCMACINYDKRPCCYDTGDVTRDNEISGAERIGVVWCMAQSQ